MLSQLSFYRTLQRKNGANEAHRVEIRGLWRVTKESLENQIRALGKILGHFPSPPLMPKFGTQLSETITLDFLIGLS